MANNGKVLNYGEGAATYVFGFYTDQALSSLVKLEAYDNASGTWTTTGSATTSTNMVLDGAGLSPAQSMIGLISTGSTGNVTASGATWFATLVAAGPTGGTDNPNLLQGTTSYVTCIGDILDATETCFFNMCASIPSGTLTTDPMQFDLCARYTYTGTAPTPYFVYNDDGDGTDAVDSVAWETITKDTYGVKHCRSGCTTSTLYANIPESGSEVTVEGWVVNSSNEIIA